MSFLGRLSNMRRLFASRGGSVPEVDAKEARRLQKAGAVIVDVRMQAEYRGGHIPGALHVPMTEVESRLSEIPRDRPVVLHCAMGARSALATARLKELGYEDVHNLQGGIRAWKDEGLPLEK